MEILVEEPSAKLVLEELIPRIVPGVPHDFVVFQGKPDMLKKLPGRLRGYAKTMEFSPLKLVILLDRDGDDCVRLKQDLTKQVVEADLASHTVLTRIAIDELEAWYFGDVPALCAVYPRVSPDLAKQQKYRDPDSIPGKSSKALEHVLQVDKLAKGQIARDVAPHRDVESNRSKSFQVFRDGVRRLVSEGSNAETH